MKFIKHTFLIALFAVMCGLIENTAMGCTSKKGKVCLNSSNRDCRPGCYCTGSGSSTNMSGSDFEKNCANRNAGNISGIAGANLCPADFPHSAEGASKIEDCFAWWGGNGDTKINYHRIHEGCAPGYYAPGKTWATSQCKSCADLASNKYCPGSAAESGGWYVHSFDYGIKECSPGQLAKSDRTGCGEAQIHCDRGTYLPKNSSQCAECPNGYVCKGGDFHESAIDQGKEPPAVACTGEDEGIPNYNRSGCQACPAGYAPNADHTKCDTKSIKVDPGSYLPANTDTATTCQGDSNISSNEYCPGGTFTIKAGDQGIETCPYSGRSTIDKTKCTFTLTKEQMRNGITGAGKCWLKTDPDDYKKCIYGVELRSDRLNRQSFRTN